MNTNLTLASFHFSLFVATFLVFPIVVIVLPLGSPRCVFPVVLSRFGVEVLGHGSPLTRARAFKASGTARIDSDLGYRQDFDPKTGKHNGEDTTGRPQGKHNDNNGEYQESSYKK